MTMTKTKAFNLAVSLAALIVLFGWHLSVGAKTIELSSVAKALLSFDANNFNHLIIYNLRLPRAIAAVLVGASLATAGALMQGVTRNPLADPGLLGLLAGASLAAVSAIFLFGASALPWLPFAAAIGALASAVIVWQVSASAPGGATPLTLTLVGAVVASFLFALVSILQLQDQATFTALRLWLVGSLAGVTWSTLLWSSPWLAVALCAAALLAPSVTTLALGEDTASGLGVNTQRQKPQLLACVVILTAASVAIAGPLGFIGLIVPHVGRLFVGADYRWLVPTSALLGAAFLLAIDTLARVVLRPIELSTGLLTSLIGAPVFLYLVQRKLR